jgi:sporulation protein YlmC with PRC-barrel domain
MNKRNVLFLFLVVFSLVLAACGPAAEEPENLATPALPLETPLITPPGGEEVGTPEAQATPIQNQETEVAVPTEEISTPDPVGTPIVPETGVQMRPHLSEMLEFEVVDVNNTRVGAVTDYVINMCEAHLLYVVVDTTQGDIVTGQGLMLIPYEAFSLSGEIRTGGQRQLILNMATDELVNVPIVDEVNLDMTNTEWESEVIGFWEERAPMTFTSVCPVPPAGEQNTSERINITRIALATELLSAEVEDGIGDSMGQVAEAIIIPESGLIRYIVMHTADQFSSLTLVPMGALNVSHEAHDGTERTVLILLVEREILEGSPRVETVPESWETVESQGSFDYWSQHVPMTREDLP